MNTLEKIEGTLTKAGTPSEFKNNWYQWGEIDGKEVQFVNQDNSSFVGRHVLFVDKGEQKNGIKIQQKKNGAKYAKISGGRAVELSVDGQITSKIPIAGGGGQSSGGWDNQQSSGGWDQPAQQTQRTSQAPAEKCYEDRVKYGAGAVKLMAGELGMEGEMLNKFLATELAAAVFNSSMYAFKDNIPLTDPVKAAENAFGVEHEENPFNDDADSDNIVF